MKGGRIHEKRKLYLMLVVCLLVSIPFLYNKLRGR